MLRNKEPDCGVAEETWCGVSVVDTYPPSIPAEVDCEACLSAAYEFGEACMTRRCALWDAQDAAAEQAAPPREVMPPPGRETTTATLADVSDAMRTAIIAALSERYQ